jgi:hypothetical protein
MEFADLQNKDEVVLYGCLTASPSSSNPDEFTRQLVLKHFKATKFSSFTRNVPLGFRQVNCGIGPIDPIILETSISSAMRGSHVEDAFRCWYSQTG